MEGNKSMYRIMKLNASNSDFITKIPELRATIDSNNTEIVIISESNAEVDNPERSLTRSKAFPDFKFEDKKYQEQIKPDVPLW